MTNPKIKIFKISIFLTFLFVLCLNAQTAQQKLNKIRKLSNYKVEEIKPDIYKITDKLTGKTIYKNIGEYHRRSKTKNIISGNVDTTVFYPNQIDTTTYSGMYNFWMTSDVSDLKTLVVGDINKNGNPELYGLRYNSLLQIDERSIYEYNPMGQDFEFKANLSKDSTGYFTRYTQIYDVNGDGIEETFISGFIQYPDSVVGIERAYKLNDTTNLPTELDFEYNTYLQLQVNDPIWGEYDKKEGADLFYCSIGPDKNHVWAAEYDKNINNINAVYNYEVPVNTILFLAGTSNGDIDGDGYADLTTGGVNGDIVIFEYQPDLGNYKDVWYGDAGTYNVYIHFYTNDIDGNGKKELWVGGDATYNGVTKTRLTAFEAVGDNQYEAVHVIDIVGIISFDAYNGFAVDIDKDGTEEIGLCLDQTFMIMKFTGTENQWSFNLFYLKSNAPYIDENYNGYHGAIMYDIDNDGYEELLIQMYTDPPNLGNLFVYTQIYHPTDLVSVAEDKQIIKEYRLNQNYPNPFNPSTIISYGVAERSNVNISVFNILGQKIIDLISKEQPKGNYQTTFDGSKLTSGIYLVRMTAGKYSKTIKTLLLK